MANKKFSFVGNPKLFNLLNILIGVTLLGSVYWGYQIFANPEMSWNINAVGATTFVVLLLTLTAVQSFFIRQDNLKLRRSENYLIQSKKVALQAAEKSMQETEAKSLFLSQMSHEVRTPLNAMMGITEVLAGSHLNAEQRKCVSVLSRSGETLLKVIGDLLDLSRIETGRLELDHIPFDLREVVQPCLDMVKVVAAQKGVEFGYVCEPSVPQRMMGDPARIKQVLLNLMINVLSAVNGGKIEVKVSRAYSENESKLVFAVQPESQLLTPALEGLIEETKSPVETGLAISHQLIQLMHGKLIPLFDSSGVGLSFNIPLDIAAEAGPKLQLVKAPSTEMQSVLIVEDDEDCRLLLTKYFQRENFELTMARNGQEAIDKFQTAHYDLILMDIHMPVLNGYEATKAIRTIEKAEKRPPTPIIAISAYAMNSDAQKSLEVGCNRHIAKPMKKEFLLKTIYQVLDEGSPEKVTAPRAALG